MHYMLLSTLFTCLLVSCDAIPQTLKGNVESSDVDNSNDSDSPASLDLLTRDESVLFRRNAEESEVGSDEQTANDDDVFADRAEVIAVHTFLVDTLYPEDLYASQKISILIEEYKEERPVRRSSCEVIASGVYETKEVEMASAGCIRLLHLEPLPTDLSSPNLYSLISAARYNKKKPFKVNVSFSRLPSFIMEFTLESNGVTSNPIRLDAPHWSIHPGLPDDPFMIEGVWRHPPGESVPIVPYRTMGMLEWTREEDDDDFF